MPKNTLSDQDPLSNSGFRKSLQEVLGNELHLSTAYHLQMDGQTERVNRILEDLLRACIINFGGSWNDHLHLVEFAYNNFYRSSTGIGPHEALYGRLCKALYVGGKRVRN